MYNNVVAVDIVDGWLVCARVECVCEIVLHTHTADENVINEMRNTRPTFPTQSQLEKLLIFVPLGGWLSGVVRSQRSQHPNYHCSCDFAIDNARNPQR